MKRDLCSFAMATVSTISLAAALAGSRAALAADVVDQQQTLTPLQVRSTSSTLTTPIGQEFTPSLNSIGFVDLLISDGGSDIGPGASFRVNVRSGTIGGTILGTSDTAFVPDGTNTGVTSTIYTHFTFAAPIALTPGSLYVLEAVQLQPFVTGTHNFGLVGRTVDSYAGGRAITDGLTEANFDYNFREGVVPEPTSLAVVALTALACTRRRPAA